MAYMIQRVRPEEKRMNQKVDDLLRRGDIQRDKNLDYTAAMLDDDYNVIATGSCFGNTLRCFAVSPDHQGEGLLNEIVQHLMEVQFDRGNTHLFLYTKCNSAKFFGDIGFAEIARVKDRVVFMENRRTGFPSYLKALGGLAEPLPQGAKVGALVMNANPFTNGHLYLAEKAASECDRLYLFMVSEDASLVPFAVRKKLIMEGTAHLKNIVYCESGPYMISSATFPSYFLKEEALVSESHARLDIAVFAKIAASLGITDRFMGEEPTSVVTSIYNRVMSEELGSAGVTCHIIPRLEAEGKAISASTVRQCIHDNNIEKLRSLVPETTFAYFTSAEAAPVIESIRKSANVVHH